jgi:2-dehydro-3-deoxygluconokinase
MKTVTFGEIMLRLSPPGFERLLQSPQFSATFGGGEANVAVSLAQFGCESYYVTRLPAHAIGDAAVRALRAEGVRTDFIQRGGSRVGIYFAETGAAQRASTVIYDRAASSVSELKPGSVPWADVFAGARWFHCTGITPALGSALAASTREALEAARKVGVRVSFDLNFRKKLWSESAARDTVRPMMPLVDVVIANEEDIQSVLGLEVPETDVMAGTLNLQGYHAVAKEVAKTYGVKQIAITLRESYSASDNGWSACLFDSPTGAFHVSQRYDVRLVDRIGGGDSFAAGLIYATLRGDRPDAALRFAVAASALKQTIPGDFNRVSAGEVDRLVGGDASGRVQR